MYIVYDGMHVSSMYMLVLCVRVCVCVCVCVRACVSE